MGVRPASAVRSAATGKGFVVVKCSKPGQDLRFDVPTVGPLTIDAMAEAGATVLAVEAHKTLLLDRDEVVRRADKAKIAVLGRVSEIFEL